MKTFAIEDRKYTLLDFIQIPFTVSPVTVTLRLALDYLARALIPSAKVLATAGFIDAADGTHYKMIGTRNITGISQPLVVYVHNNNFDAPFLEAVDHPNTDRPCSHYQGGISRPWICPPDSVKAYGKTFNQGNIFLP